MREYRMGQAAGLLGVSVDTVRRWADSGRLPTTRTTGGHRVVSGTDLAALAATLTPSPESESLSVQSARNRLVGIVTSVTRDKVMAQVEVQAGPHRVVSLISREATDELGLEPGVLVAAVVKATNVTIELLATE
ncbi:MAG TPA: helix-turn-helix transcriptional regulator [Actinomycetota bacterium]|jgi:molybdopterin-binding protein|nr:helix-turn-helix transcriptional regulator [Actinomycetota bacterium]